jgi:hypothetical protein
VSRSFYPGILLCVSKNWQLPQAQVVMEASVLCSLFLVLHARAAWCVPAKRDIAA